MITLAGVDLAAEKRNGDFIRTQILAGTVTACHDCSDGGLAVTTLVFDVGDGPLTEGLRDFQVDSDPRGLVGFVTVESEFYPDLAECFGRRAAEWLERRLREVVDEAD